jgi:plasmid replication initiation protein
MNEVVKYNNQMNDVNFKDFTPIELDLLMTICSKMKEQGLTIIEFSFEQLKRISNYDPKQSNKKFIKDLEKTYDKLIQLNFKIGDDRNFTKFVLFNEYTVKGDSGTVTIGVNPKFYFVLNELTSNFTRFELKEFINLKSKYSKECYRRLKQFRKTGLWTVEIEEFRRILDIPNSYKFCEINRSVLTPIIKELTPLFKNLQIEKIKKKGAYSGRGNKVTHIVFTFEKEDEVPFNVRLNGIKTKLSVIERDIFENNGIEENQELDGQIDLFFLTNAENG